MNKILLSFLFTVCAMSAQAQCPNLVTNGDFEMGNAGFTSQYPYVAPPLNPTSLYGEGVYAMTTNPRNVHTNFPIMEDHTSGSGTFMMVTNGAVQSNVILWSQLIAVKPGTSYTLEAWAAAMIHVIPARLKFYINGMQAGNTFIPNARAWTQFTADWNSGLATTALITIIDENTEAGGNDFTLDDISFRVAAVPTVTVGDVSTFGRKNTIYIGYGPEALTFTAAGSGGAGGYTYQVNNSPFSENPSLTIGSAGIYKVNVKDANNCISTVSANVTVVIKDVRCGHNNNKVAVCHNTGSASNPTNALCISPNAVPAHLSGHDDWLGDCGNSFAKGAAGSISRTDLEAGDIAVFPNPAHGKINLALKEDGSVYQSYEVLDMNGRVLLYRRLGADIHADLISIDISAFVPGLYIIHAVTDEGARVLRFTVQ